MSFDGPAVVVEPKLVAIRVFIMVEDQFLTDERTGVESNKELVSELAHYCLFLRVVHVVPDIVVLLIDTQFVIVGLFDSL